MARLSREKLPKHPGIYRETYSGGDERYVVMYRDHANRQRSKSFPTLKEARAHQSRELVDRERGSGLRADADRVSFREYAQLYVSRHPEWAEGTRRTTEYRLGVVNELLGHRRLSGLVAGDVQELVATLRAKGNAPSTIAAHRNLVASILGAAVDDRLIAHNPAQAVKVPRVKKHAAARAALLTPEQVAQLIEHLPDHWKAYGQLIAWTGLRSGEAAGLTIDRVDFLHSSLTIDRQLIASRGKAPVFGPPKTPSSVRVLPMGEAVAALLREHIESRRLGESGLLFTTRTGAPMGRSARGDAWRTASHGLGLPEAARGWHALRHTYGSMLLAAGVDVVTVSAWLGHNGPAETLATYAHVDPANLLATADVAAQLMAARRPN